MPKSDRQPIVELKIEGILIPAYKYLVGFKVTKKLGVWTGEIELFDPDWTNLESLSLTAGFGSTISFRYGWEGSVTGWYDAQLKSYVPDFSSDGLRVTLGWMFASASITKTVAKYVYSEGRKISDIVSEIASRNALGAEIEETKGTLDRPLIQSGISDFKFLKNILAPRAINRDGLGGYQVMVTKDNLVFKTFVERNRKIYKEYNVQRGVDGEVISFSPSDDVSKMAFFGATRTTVVAIDPQEKSILNSTYKIEQATNIPNDGGKISSPVLERDKSKEFRIVNKPYHRKEDVDNYSKILVTSSAPWMYSASAEILGDPYIPIMGYLKFLVITSVGIIHHTSGIYQVWNIEDSISNGEFTTSIELRRFSSPKGEDQMNTVEPNIIRTSPQNSVIIKEAEIFL